MSWVDKIDDTPNDEVVAEMVTNLTIGRMGLHDTLKNKPMGGIELAQR